MSEKTFADLFCQNRNCAPHRFEQAVLREALYPHARLVAPLVRLIWPRYFEADLEFVRGVALLRRVRDFGAEAEAFAHHPENSGSWRSGGLVRISSRRLRRLVRETLHADPAGAAEEAAGRSAPPFAGRASRRSRRRGATVGVGEASRAAA